MRIDVLSLFPDYFQSPLALSILGRACRRGLLRIRQFNIRDFAPRRRVDDRPYGGGPGMVMRPEVVAAALQAAASGDEHVLYLTPQGRLLDHARCRQLASEKHLVLLCGHYEGIDSRVVERRVDEEISIGDYVLISGCAAALVVIEAVARFVPGVLGNPRSTAEETFQGGDFEGPQYTRPPLFEGQKVPEILRSGDHAQIARWRKQQGEAKMRRVRPDLLGGK